MPYRNPDPVRTMEAAREAEAGRAAFTQACIRGIAREISRLDEHIGRWSARFADGETVPPHVWALVVEKQNCERELRRICGKPSTYPRAASVIDHEPDQPEGPRACVSWSIAGSPLLGGFLLGLAFSSTPAFFLTLSLCF